MKIALCNVVLRDLPFPQQCAEAKRLGYDAIEIAPFTIASEPHRLDTAAISNIRRTVESAGLTVSGLHSLMVAPQGLSITADDDDVATQTQDIGQRLIALCADLGGRYLVHGSSAQRRLQPGQEAAGRKRARAYFEAMAKAADQNKVVYCIEALAPDLTDYITSIAEAAEIADDISSPSLKTMIDCCHASRSERSTIPELLKRYLPSRHIGHVHANDTSRRGPGQGELDFIPILQTLRDLDYRGTIGVEPFLYEPDGLTCAKQSIDYLRACDRSSRPV